MIEFEPPEERQSRADIIAGLLLLTVILAIIAGLALGLIPIA